MRLLPLLDHNRSFNGHGTHRAPASVDRELQLLSRIFNLAIERGEVRDNPCKGVKLLAVNNQVTRYLTPEQEEKPMLVFDGRRAHLRDILTINLHTGMRRPVHPAIKSLLQRFCD